MSERITEADLRALAAHRTYDDGARLITEVRRLRGLILAQDDRNDDDYLIDTAFKAEADAIRAEQDKPLTPGA